MLTRQFSVGINFAPNFTAGLESWLKKRDFDYEIADWKEYLFYDCKRTVDKTDGEFPIQEVQKMKVLCHSNLLCEEETGKILNKTEPRYCISIEVSHDEILNDFNDVSGTFRISPFNKSLQNCFNFTEAPIKVIAEAQITDVEAEELKEPPLPFVEPEDPAKNELNKAGREHLSGLPKGD